MPHTLKRILLLLLIPTLILGGCAAQRAEPESGSSEAGDSFTVTELYVQNGALSIYGKLYVPSGQEGKLPAVILSHSSDLTSDSMTSYCERIASLGYIAYAFDFCGGSKHSRSDGEASEMTVFTEVEDLKAVLNAVSQLEMVDASQIFLFGTSQGGLVSALVAEERPEDVAGLILFYPAFNIAELVQKFYSGVRTVFQNAYAEALLDYNVFEHIGAYPGDVLIVHGSRDFIVPCSYSEDAAALYPNCELFLIEGASHGFNDENFALGDYDEASWRYAERYLAQHRENP